jgi:glyoxalase superfamily protein
VLVLPQHRGAGGGVARELHCLPGGPGGVAPQIFLQEVPEPKVVKNRIYLDLRVGGGLKVPVALRKQRVEAEVDRLIGAGATRLGTFDEVVADRYFVVMQDPEGNEFCLS